MQPTLQCICKRHYNLRVSLLIVDLQTRVMITLEERGQGRIFAESVQFGGEQGDVTDKQYVFPRQCLVLGDSEVGKTSLVKSLTGKPFDPKQQKTQGMDQCLVDNEWKNCNLKDLVLGDLWKFLGSGQVELVLRTSGTATFCQEVEIFSKPWRIFFDFAYLIPIMLFFVSWLVGIIFNFPINMRSCLIVVIHFGLMNFHCVVTRYKSTSNLRFISATLVFMLSCRGFLIGSYLPLVMCYFDESYIAFASTRAFLMLGIGAGIAFVAIFILIGPIQMPFCTGGLVQNRNFIPILCVCRLLLSIFIGVIIGSVAATSVLRGLDDESCTETLNTSIPLNWHRAVQTWVTYFDFNSPTEFFREYENTIRIKLSIQRGLWGPFNILLILAAFYHLKLVFTTPIFYFVITYPLFICFSFCQEWFRVRSMPNITRCPSNNSMILMLMATGKVDTAMLKGALNEKFPSLKLQILDFAGDKEYYAYHHMFLKSQAIYVIVFNVAKHIQNNFKNIDIAIERFQFWLESVCSHVPPKTPIFLVGTHRGDLDEVCMQIINDHLKEQLWNSYCDELVVNDVDGLIFFPVENSKGENDVGVQSLRIKLMLVAEERDAARDCDIPLSWITIKDAIINQREMERAKFCVTLQEFPYVFNNFICTSWSKETLKYFHEKGLVIYLDKDPELSEWVLLKPEILVDIIIQLVTPPPQMIQEKGFRRDWKLLHGKGILTKSLLTRIISTVQENKETMTAFLEKYDLICPLSNNKVKMCSLYDDEEHQPTHFVPSLLPMSAEGSIPTWLDNTTDKKFYVFFKRFLPEPLFHRLLSRAHKNSKLEFPNGPVVMFKDVGKFWMSPKQPYRLKLVKEEAIIEVTFSSR